MRIQIECPTQTKSRVQLVGNKMYKRILSTTDKSKQLKIKDRKCLFEIPLFLMSSSILNMRNNNNCDRRGDIHVKHNPVESSTTHRTTKPSASPLAIGTISNSKLLPLWSPVDKRECKRSYQKQIQRRCLCPHNVHIFFIYQNIYLFFIILRHLLQIIIRRRIVRFQNHRDLCLSFQTIQLGRFIEVGHTEHILLKIWGR